MLYNKRRRLQVTGNLRIKQYYRVNHSSITERKFQMMCHSASSVFPFHEKDPPVPPAIDIEKLPYKKKFCDMVTSISTSFAITS